MNDWKNEEKVNIYFESQYDIAAGDTIQFSYHIPQNTLPTNINDSFLWMDVEVSYKDRHSHFRLYPIFKSNGG